MVARFIRRSRGNSLMRGAGLLALGSFLSACGGGSKSSPAPVVGPNAILNGSSLATATTHWVATACAVQVDLVPAVYGHRHRRNPVHPPKPGQLHLRPDSGRCRVVGRNDSGANNTPVPLVFSSSTTIGARPISKKWFSPFLGFCGLLALSLFACPSHAQSSTVQSKPPMYSYVANWQIPRTHWSEMPQSEAADKSVMDHALADGTIIGYGNDQNLVHTPDGETHDDWW